VQIMVDTKIMRITPGTVYVERPGGEASISADTVVICLGSKSNDVLANELRGAVTQVLVVGDALDPRKVTEAMVEGAVAALYLREEDVRKAA